MSVAEGVRSPDGWGQKVAGRCPACCSDGTLFVAQGQHVTCSLVGCPDPTLVAELLSGPSTRRRAALPYRLPDKRDRQVTAVDVTILRVTNRSPAFYPLVGPFLARREVDDELGVPLWDDDDRTWWIALHQGQVVGFAVAVAGPDAVRFGAAWVHPDWRRRGIHRQLVHARLDAHPGRMITASCTPDSLSNFLAAGFRYVAGTPWTTTTEVVLDRTSHDQEAGSNG